TIAPLDEFVALPQGAGSRSRTRGVRADVAAGRKRVTLETSEGVRSVLLDDSDSPAGSAHGGSRGNSPAHRSRGVITGPHGRRSPALENCGPWQVSSRSCHTLRR